jgi:hypothetical protein
MIAVTGPALVTNLRSPKFGTANVIDNIDRHIPTARLKLAICLDLERQLDRSLYFFSGSASRIDSEIAPRIGGTTKDQTP